MGAGGQSYQGSQGYYGTQGTNQRSSGGYDESNGYQRNMQANTPVGEGIPSGYSNNLEDHSNVLSPTGKQSQELQAQYYQPEGQRIIDEKLEEIRRRNRAIQ